MCRMTANVPCASAPLQNVSQLLSSSKNFHSEQENYYRYRKEIRWLYLH